MITIKINKLKIINNEFEFYLQCDYINYNNLFKFTNNDNKYCTLIEEKFGNEFDHISNIICNNLVTR